MPGPSRCRCPDHSAPAPICVSWPVRACVQVCAWSCVCAIACGCECAWSACAIARLRGAQPFDANAEQREEAKAHAEALTDATCQRCKQALRLQHANVATHTHVSTRARTHTHTHASSVDEVHSVIAVQPHSAVARLAVTPAHARSDEEPNAAAVSPAERSAHQPANGFAIMGKPPRAHKHEHAQNKKTRTRLLPSTCDLCWLCAMCSEDVWRALLIV
jgi:hypothetical protein